MAMTCTMVIPGGWRWSWESFKPGWLIEGFNTRQEAHKLAGEYAKKFKQPFYVCCGKNLSNFVCDKAWLERHCTDLEPDDYYKVVHWMTPDMQL